MKQNIILIQRFLPNYRKAFFDALYQKKQFKLIVSKKSIGKIVTDSKINEVKYIVNNINILLGKNHILFPFLFFKLIRLKPKWVVSEGGSNTVNNIQVWLYCKLFRCKYIIWDLGKFYGKFTNNIFRKIYSLLYDSLMKNANLIYAYNTASKDYFEKRYPNKKIIVLGNTIDTEEITNIKSNLKTEEIKNLKNKFNKYKYLYLYVGAINPQKELEKLMYIHSKLSYDYGLIIIGNGEKNYINSLLKIYSKNIFFEGYKNLYELGPYYTIADFSILPGLGGLSINQSMAFSTPVICSSADGTEKDLVINDKTGFIFDKIIDSVDYITTKTKKDWELMGKQAMLHVYGKFSLSNMIDNFLQQLK